jgi:hypothetical protein
MPHEVFDQRDDSCASVPAFLKNICAVKGKHSVGQGGCASMIWHTSGDQVRYSIIDDEA